MPARQSAPKKRARVQPTRTVTFGVANSLDNFIARKDHAVDWLTWTDEIGAITAEYWKTIDTVLMGRKTYEVAPAEGYPDVKNYVFSRTLKRTRHPQVELVAGNAVAFVRNLKRQAGKGICVMGGGELAKALFEAGLIDEIGFNIHPVLLGSGIPLFYAMPKQIDLELLECRQFKNGCVFVRYRVKH